MRFLGDFRVQDTHIGIDHDVLVSLPLYCKIGGISMNEIDYEGYHLRLKPLYNNPEWIRKFQQEFTDTLFKHSGITPSEDLKYKNFFQAKAW